MLNWPQVGRVRGSWHTSSSSILCCSDAQQQPAAGRPNLRAPASRLAAARANSGPPPLSLPHCLESDDDASAGQEGSGEDEGQQDMEDEEDEEEASEDEGSDYEPSG